MESIGMTSGAYFKSIKIVHAALVIGVVFFALASIILQLNGFGTIADEIKYGLLVVVPLFALIGIFTSNLIFKKRISNVSKKTSLREKMDDYRSSLIIKLALIEGPAFFAVVAYMLTGDYIFLGISIVLIIVFVIYAPTRTKFINELDLNKTEIEIINNPESQIL